MTSAREGVWTAWGGILPSLSGGVDYSWSKSPQSLKIFANPYTGGTDTALGGGTSNSWSARLGINQRLFDGLANYYSIREAQQSLTGYQQQYREGQQQVYVGITREDHEQGCHTP